MNDKSKNDAAKLITEAFGTGKVESLTEHRLIRSAAAMFVDKMSGKVMDKYGDTDEAGEALLAMVESAKPEITDAIMAWVDHADKVVENAIS